MPIACRNKLSFGKTYCVTDCPTRVQPSPLSVLKIAAPGDVPPAAPRTIDVAVLDMNYGWPNLGHDSIVHAVMDAACDLLDVFREVGFSLRVLSFDIRRSGVVPEGPGRYALYLGTGGPGHIDPAFNDCVFMWDSCFMTLFGRYGARAFPFVRTLDNFYAKQHVDGFICREIGRALGDDRFPRFDPSSTGPNVMAWA